MRAASSARHCRNETPTSKSKPCLQNNHHDELGDVCWQGACPPRPNAAPAFSVRVLEEILEMATEQAQRANEWHDAHTMAHE